MRLPPPVGPRAFGDLEKSHYLCRRVYQQDTEIQANAGRDDREVRRVPCQRGSKGEDDGDELSFHIALFISCQK